MDILDIGYALPADKLKDFGWDEKKLIQLCLDNGAGTESVSNLADALFFLFTETITIELKVTPIIGLSKTIYVNVEHVEEDGKFYIIFDEDDLYERSLSPIGQALQAKEILPEMT